ncbi:NAD(+) salvage pathway protein [Lecanicillium sp. MT-2017a]|nr:NAD(+) salvage pathway protein [Lecanicillium sp. MT-2017a]
MAPFKAALIVVDFQEDFCPPNGSLAVQDGRTIAPKINTLLSLPFSLRIATRDWHPEHHISFASSHESKAPFTSTHTITDPATGASYTTTLWPDHCVADTAGAQLVPELDAAAVQLVVDKGKVQDREMYSAFYDPFRHEDSGLASMLWVNGVTHVYVVGLAFDYCVKATAEHAAEEGYTTYVVGDATKAVFPDKWEDTVKELEAKGVTMITSDAEEIKRVANKT